MPNQKRKQNQPTTHNIVSSRSDKCSVCDVGDGKILSEVCRSNWQMAHFDIHFPSQCTDFVLSVQYRLQTTRITRKILLRLSIQNEIYWVMIFRAFPHRPSSTETENTFMNFNFSFMKTKKKREKKVARATTQGMQQYRIHMPNKHRERERESARQEI